MAGLARTFSPAPDLVAVMDTGNDCGQAATSEQAAIPTFLTGILGPPTARPSTPASIEQPVVRLGLTTWGGSE